MRHLSLRRISLATVVCFASCLLSGCADVQWDVTINDNMSATIGERIKLDNTLSSFLSQQENPDFWSVLQAFAKSRHWRYEARATNRINLHGTIQPEQVQDIPNLIAEQLRSTAITYGATPVPNSTVKTDKFAIERTSGFLADSIKLSGDIDLSIGRMQSELALPLAWAAELKRWNPDMLPIKIHFSSPWRIKSTNGVLDGHGGVDYTLHLGKLTHVEILYEKLNLPAIIGLIAASLGLLLTGVWLLKRRSKSGGA